MQGINHLNKYAFVIPVYNDWESVTKLLDNIIAVIPDKSDLTFILVNDASSVPFETVSFARLESDVIFLDLSRNMGHQRAIAVGLAYANEHVPAQAYIVLDSDGEDRPEDIALLIEKAENFDGVVFAKRAKRSEGLVFRLFYTAFKFAFFLLTGKKISFGNFSIFQQHQLSRIVHISDIWNHFSGGIIRSGIPYASVDTIRGKRYYGQSKMNFVRLILHGLSAISVYADFMAIRLIIASIIISAFTVAGIITAASIRLFTNLAIPGWATFTILALAILLLLTLLTGFQLIFNVLILKTQRTIIPAKDYGEYIINVRKSSP